MKQSLQLKSKNTHPSKVLCEGTYTHKESYFGETRRNIKIWWEEHEDTHKDSEPAHHLRNHLTQSCTWEVLISESTGNHVRKNMENSIITLKHSLF